MTPQEFNWLRSYLKQRSGLDLSVDKGYLVECRLVPVARAAGLPSLSALIAALSGDRDPRLSATVVEAMTTNESSFFRDKLPFEHFRNVMLPAMQSARAMRRTIRVWCAAASTGQEPYSLGICVKEDQAKLAGWRVEFLATDIAANVAARGEKGIYSQFEVQRGMPIQLLVKYFRQDGDMWQVSEEVRRMVRWKVFNLLESYAPLGRFDIVFCRNVLIYFDRDMKSQILARIADTLEPDGYLVLGAAETVVGLTDRFQPIDGLRGLYRPVPAAGQRPGPALQLAAG